MVENKQPTAEELVAAGVQSPFWEKYNSYRFATGVLVLDHPREPMPKPKADADGKPQVYDLIARTGEKLTGLIHDGFFAEWAISGEGDGETLPLDNWIILAWKEHQNVPAQTEQV